MSLDSVLAEPPAARWPMLFRRVEPGAVEQILLDLTAETEYLIQDEIVRGIAAARAVVDLADASSCPLPRVRSRRVLAMALAHASQFDDALSTCDDAVSLAERLSLTIEGARCRLASIQPLANLGRFNDAIATGTTALELLESEGASDLAGRAHLNIGSTWAMCDQPAKALSHFDKARDVLGSTPPLLAQIESNRGNALSDLDRYDEAEEAFAASELGFSGLEMEWAAAIAAENLANLCVRQGRLDRALAAFERASHLLAKDDSIADFARVESGRADALTAIGLPADAIAAYDRALPQLAVHSSAADLVLARIGLGRAHLMLGHAAEAESTLAEAERAIDQDKQPMAVAQCAALRAEAALIAGDTGLASHYAHAAACALSERPLQRAIIEILQARISLAVGNPDEACDVLNGVLDRVRPMGIAPLIADSSQLLGRVYDELGQPGSANDARRAAIVQVERTRGTLQAERLRSAYLGDRLGAYHDLYVALMQEGSREAIQEAFHIAERARSRALLDALGGEPESIGTASPGERELIEKIADHRRGLNWTYSQIADGREPEDDLLEQLQGREQILAELTTRLGIVATTASSHLEPGSVAEVQALLPENGALISYMAAGGALHAILVADKDVVAFPFLASWASIEILVERLQFQLQRAIVRRQDRARLAARMLADTRRELAALHEAIVTPLLKQLGNRGCLVIVPCGVLHAVPFAALHGNDGYLIERHEIAMLPSASMIRHLKPVSAPVDSASALIVSVADTDAPELVYEARTIASLLPGSRLVIGEQATVDAVSDSMTDPSLVHLACHGQFHAALPDASGLRLADRWMTVKELYQLRLRASLITLSGCETGRSRVGTGDELVGLATALFTAGAQSLLVSLWMTDDRETSVLMTKFYRELRDGSRPLEALRQTQRTALANNAHPAFWASFVFMGRPWKEGS